MSQKVAFIGAGNMAEAIFAGMINNKLYTPDQIYVTNRSDRDHLEKLHQTYGVQIPQDKETIFENSDIIIIAMKPKDIEKGIESIKPFIKKSHLLISVIAGVSTETIQHLLELDIPVVRAMPNTSSTIGQGATGICKGIYATEEHVKTAVSLFETTGIVEVVKEEEFHALTSVSGSGPAYIYYIAEAMEQTAINLGLDKSVAKNLVAQTIIGAGEMLKHSPKDPGTLRKEVMSPNGTTEAGIKVLESHQVQKAIDACIRRAAQRSEELGEELDKKVKNK